MSGRRPKTARAIAMAVLNQFDPEHNYAGPILNELLQQTDEKQRAVDLVFGTIRNAKAIDTVIAKLTDCPAERIPAKLLNIIRIGVYELIYSPQTGEYAIVNEAVESTKAFAAKKQTGFVNAVLRQIARHIQNRRAALSGTNAQRTLPQTPLVGCEFDSDILPEPAASPADYLSSAFSLPEWLVTDWLADFGPEETKKICFASNRKPGIYVRANALKTTAQKLAEKFRQAGIDFEIADGSMVKIKSPRAVAELPGFTEGLFSVQDITASQAVKTLEPKPYWSILDLCAAPGGKTTQLAELTGDKAKIIATDINSRRLEKVKENIARLGISSVRIAAYEELGRKAAGIGPFDAVLLDVPCSNTGVLAKRPEVRYRIKPKTIQELMKLQRGLLDAAVTMVKPQGKICYSTCSIQTGENGALVKEFLLRNRNFELESERLYLPSRGELDCDGGYVAIITKE